jgi:hypothetical protein
MSKKQYEKILSESFVDTNRNVTEDEALKMVADAEFALKEIISAKEADIELQSARQICKDLNGGYNSAAKYEKAKIEFLLEKIEDTRYLKKLTEKEK